MLVDRQEQPAGGVNHNPGTYWQGLFESGTRISGDGQVKAENQLTARPPTADGWYFVRNQLFRMNPKVEQ
jgi:hypothetical protein